MCIKPDCTVLAHKNNPWTFDTSLISSSGRFVFIGVKDREDLVWTATTLPFETIQQVWDSVSGDRRPLTQWQNFFDQMRGADGSGKHVNLALQASADAAADIRATGAISPLKRAHEEMTSPPQDIRGQDLFREFTDALDEPSQILTVNEAHRALMGDY